MLVFKLWFFSKKNAIFLHSLCTCTFLHVLFHWHFIIDYYNNLNVKYLVVWYWDQFLLADILQQLRGCHHWDVTCCKLVPHSYFSAGVEAVLRVSQNCFQAVSKLVWMGLTKLDLKWKMWGPSGWCVASLGPSWNSTEPSSFQCHQTPGPRSRKSPTTSSWACHNLAFFVKRSLLAAVLALSGNLFANFVISHSWMLTVFSSTAISSPGMWRNAFGTKSSACLLHVFLVMLQFCQKTFPIT